MKTISIEEAAKELKQIIRDLADDPGVVTITGPEGRVVMVSEDTWRSLQETLYLLSVPGLKESISEGMAEAVEACCGCEELEW